MPRVRVEMVCLGLVLFSAGFLAGCVDGGLKVGPFPVSLAVGDGTVDAEALGAEPGKFGAFTAEIPLCNLPTRAEVDALVAGSANGGLADGFELTELIVEDLVLTANEGSFAGLTSLSAFVVPAGLEPSLFGATPLGTAALQDIRPGEVVLTPPNAVNVLALLQDNADGECATLLVVVSGIAPSEPIVWQGDLFANAYGILRFSF